MKTIAKLAVLVSLIAASACGLNTSGTDDTSANDPGKTPREAADAGVSDSNDAGHTGNNATADGGTTPAVDSGTTQTPDAGGTAPDAGNAPDSGTTGTTDSGSPAADSGTADAGNVPDSGSTGNDAGCDGSSGNVPDNADVVKVSASGSSLKLSRRYIFSVSCGEVLGDMPGVGWSSGPKSCDSINEGYFTYAPIYGTVGTYAFTYRDYTEAPNGWALYGDINLLKLMSPTARSYVQCNWWDAATQTTVSVANPSCSLKALFASDGQIFGAGNMANLK